MGILFALRRTPLNVRHVRTRRKPANYETNKKKKCSLLKVKKKIFDFERADIYPKQYGFTIIEYARPLLVFRGTTVSA